MNSKPKSPAKASPRFNSTARTARFQARVNLRKFQVWIALVAIISACAREWRASKHYFTQAAYCRKIENRYLHGFLPCFYGPDEPPVERDRERADFFRRLARSYEDEVHVPWTWLCMGQAGGEAQVSGQIEPLLIELAEGKNTSRKPRRSDYNVNLSYFEYGKFEPNAVGE
jgi:hypothetical protein